MPMPTLSGATFQSISNCLSPLPVLFAQLFQLVEREYPAAVAVADLLLGRLQLDGAADLVGRDGALDQHAADVAVGEEIQRAARLLEEGEEEHREEGEDQDHVQPLPRDAIQPDHLHHQVDHAGQAGEEEHQARRPARLPRTTTARAAGQRGAALSSICLTVASEAKRDGRAAEEEPDARERGRRRAPRPPPCTGRASTRARAGRRGACGAARRSGGAPASAEARRVPGPSTRFPPPPTAPPPRRRSRRSKTGRRDGRPSSPAAVASAVSRIRTRLSGVGATKSATPANIPAVASPNPQCRPYSSPMKLHNSGAMAAPRLMPR